MSIKRKLTVVIMGVSLAAVLLTVTAITAYLIYDLRASRIRELGVTAAITGDRNAAVLTFLDSERATRNLDIFRLNPSVLAACIYDAAGVLFAGYRPERADGIDCPHASADLPPLPGRLTALREIRQNGDAAGQVFLATDTSEIDAYVHKIILISGSSALLVLAVTLLLTVYFQRSISGPILELAATAEAITGSRDYTLAARSDYDGETGILARAFNDMLEEVHQRDRELLLANATLEQKVTDRTCQLEAAKCKAEAASEAKSEFLRNMSHEFRTPLHSILSFASFGVKEHASAKAEQLRQYFEFIQKGSERLSRLVGEVLDLAKLERGEQRLATRPGDLRELAARSADMVRPLLAEKKLTLAFDHAWPPALAACDHDKIIQVITNLLGNAIKFTPAGKSITVHTHAEGEDAQMRAVLTVTDEGVGIPEDEKDAIFESFRQSSRTNTGAGGTGLGLAICRGIIGLHAGSIWAENNPAGPGARVTFAIPALREEQKHPLPTPVMETPHADAA